MANPLYFPIFRAFDDTGAPLAGGKVYTYAAGTNTPKVTYTNSTLSTANSNPVILDAEGYPTSGGIWLDGIYKIDLYDANNVQQDGFPVDNFQNDAGAPGPAGTFQMSTAGGTVDVITATYSPVVTLSNLVTVGFVASGANLTTTPTFAPDGLTAHTITKKGGQSLVAGDIPAATAVVILEYNSANTRWELINPASDRDPWVVATGTPDGLTATYAPAIPALYDGLIVTFRASAANLTTTPTFSPNGLTVRVITKSGGVALAAGNIAGNLAEYIMRYNLANTRWELLNPTTVAQPSFLAGLISGLVPSGFNNNGATTQQVLFFGGQATDTTNTAVITAVAGTWSVTNGNAINGYQGGTTLPNSSTIHIFVCSGASGSGFFGSTSLTPTLPAGYNTYYRRIFSYTTTGTGAPVGGGSVTLEAEGGSSISYLAIQALDINTTTLSTTQVLYPLSVPTGIKVGIMYRANTPTASSSIILTSGDEQDIAPAAYATTGFTTTPGYDMSGMGVGGTSNAVSQIRDGILTTDTSARIGARANAAATSLYLVTRGYKDFRR